MAASGSAHSAGALLGGSVLAALLVVVLGGCAAPGPSPTPAPAATFGVSDLVVAAGRTEVLSGDDVEVTARVENSGTLAGMLDVELSVDGVAEDRQGVSLDPGQSTTVRFVIQAGPPGDHQINLNAATATLRVTTAPAFQVSGLRLASTPAEILPGDELGYMVEVANSGTAAGTYEAELSVDGTVASRQSVPLDVGQDKTLYFTVKAGAPGTHSVEVGPAGAILTVLAPASMAVTDLQLTQAGVPTTGEVAAVVTLENQGGAYGTLTVAVTVDGKVKETRPVTVAGGERRTVEIPLAVPAPGRHTVAVGGLEQDLVVWKISRPSNGTVLVNKVKGGMGRLTIKNNDDERDVVLVLAKSSAPAEGRLRPSTSGPTSRTRSRPSRTAGTSSTSPSGSAGTATRRRSRAPRTRPASRTRSASGRRERRRRSGTRS